MDDRTMRELAAKAAGYERCEGYLTDKYGNHLSFNPLTDDGDALRLAVDLGLGFILDAEFVNVFRCGHELLVDLCEYYANHDGNKRAAARRAITRAAAEIQLSKEKQNG